MVCLQRDGGCLLECAVERVVSMVFPLKGTKIPTHKTDVRGTRIASSLTKHTLVVLWSWSTVYNPGHDS